MELSNNHKIGSILLAIGAGLSIFERFTYTLIYILSKNIGIERPIFLLSIAGRGCFNELKIITLILLLLISFKMYKKHVNRTLFIALLIIGIFLYFDIIHDVTRHGFIILFRFKFIYGLAGVFDILLNMIMIVGIVILIFGQKKDEFSIKVISLLQILFSFTGRIGRRTFWVTWFSLMAVSLIVWLMIKGSNSRAFGVVEVIFICFIYLIPCVWIGLAMQITRWHDRDKSGWMVLTCIIHKKSCFV